MSFLNFWANMTRSNSRLCILWPDRDAFPKHPRSIPALKKRRKMSFQNSDYCKRGTNSHLYSPVTLSPPTRLLLSFRSTIQWKSNTRWARSEINRPPVMPSASRQVLVAFNFKMMKSDESLDRPECWTSVDETAATRTTVVHRTHSKLPSKNLR